MRKSLFLFCCLSSTFAWLAPERCEQNNRFRRDSTVVPKNAEVENSVEEIAKSQHELLLKTYKDYKFFGVPIKGSYELKKSNGMNNIFFTFYVPYNCSFFTYDPRLLSSVACSADSCKLTHTVATTDTYTASEGYNWGVKISSKLSLFEKIFEIGGEASTGGSYTCTYVKGKTTTDSVECSTSKKNGYLQLYNVKSDMECDFGTIKMRHKSFEKSHDGFLTKKEQNEIVASATLRFYASSKRDDNIGINNYWPSSTLVDTGRISDRLLQKLLRKFPSYNPYKDLLTMRAGGDAVVNYIEEMSKVQNYRKIIPFTNIHGDSVFQYACIFTAS